MLKVIAIIAMMIDYITRLGCDCYSRDVGQALLHCIGRLTALIMIYSVYLVTLELINMFFYWEHE